MKTAVALDTETTGAEFLLGKDTPFILYACDDKGNKNKWEWNFDPVKRKSIPDKKISIDIKKFTKEYKTLVFHNTKFDIRALESVNVNLNWRGKTFDTLMASHVLNNVYSHKLKDLSRYYIGRENDEEKEIKQEVVIARRLAKKHFPEWKLGNSSAGGKEGDESFVALDYWLFKQLAKDLKLPKKHPYWSLCDKYGFGDVIRTIELWGLFTDGLTVEKLWKVYNREINLLEHSIYDMETRGINVLKDNLKLSKSNYCSIRDNLEKELLNISPINFRSQVQLPAFLFGIPKRKINPKTNKEEIVVKNSNNEEVLFSEFSFKFKASFTPLFSTTENSLELKPNRITKTNFSTDKQSIKQLLKSVLTESQRKYLSLLSDWKDVDKAIQQLETIGKFVSFDSKIFFSIKQNGTKTTRVSASNPNPQQISKGKEFENDDGSKGAKYKIRSVFGPKKDRVWYCIDYSQLQLRIFAYVSNEQGFIDALEKGYDGHQYTASMIQNKKIDAKLTPIERRVGKGVNFSFIFGASEETLNETAGVEGLMEKVKAMFPNANNFMQEIKKQVRLNGHVKTPYGYKLQLPYFDSRPKEHAGVNYIVQGCEGDIVKNAMIGVSKYLKSEDIYLDSKIEPGEAFLTLPVHDELVFDFPKEKHFFQHRKALKKIVLLMEDAGKEMGMCTPVDVEYTKTNWAETKSIDKNYIMKGAK